MFFSIANTLKDLSYIRDIFEAEQDYEKMAQMFFDIYQKSSSEGKGKQFLSSRLKPRDLKFLIH